MPRTERGLTTSGIVAHAMQARNYSTALVYTSIDRKCWQMDGDAGLAGIHLFLPIASPTRNLMLARLTPDRSEYRRAC